MNVREKLAARLDDSDLTGTSLLDALCAIVEEARREAIEEASVLACFWVPSDGESCSQAFVSLSTAISSLKTKVTK